MQINSSLLKEAIADAKAVRATALANAKASLEEAFAPRFEAMFADKLKEESDGQDEMVSEVAPATKAIGRAGGEANPGPDKEVSKGSPKKVSDAASNFKTVAVGGKEGAAGSKAPAATQSIMKEVEEDEEKENLDENELGGEEGSESGFSSEDLDEIIRELEAEVDGEAEGQSPAPEAEDPSAMGGLPTAPAPAAPLPIQPQGGEVPQLPQSPVVGGQAGLPPAPVVPPVGGGLDGAPVDGQEPAEGEEEINLEELLAALNEEAGDDEAEELDEISNNGFPKNVGGQDKQRTIVSDKNIEAKKEPNHGGSWSDVTSKNMTAKLEETTKYKIALKEAYDAIGFLRGQINEVNLLNAKLLYTNKLFKEFAGSLDDTHRMKIVENFDLTKSIREVKLAYALLAESLNFGMRTNKTSVAKPTTRRIVSQITEGLSSKPIASTKPSKELLSESSQMATRFQKLAGIKKVVIK